MTTTAFSESFTSALKNFTPPNYYRDRLETWRHVESYFYRGAPMEIGDVKYHVEVVEPSDGEDGGSKQSFVLKFSADGQEPRYVEFSFYYSSWGEEPEELEHITINEVKPQEVVVIQYVDVAKD